jgi:hypothetical protein
MWLPSSKAVNLNEPGRATSCFLCCSCYCYEENAAELLDANMRRLKHSTYRKLIFLHRLRA